MTKKDYELIARVLSDPTLHLPETKRRAIASRFVDEFELLNPRFNRATFLKACGVTEAGDWGQGGEHAANEAAKDSAAFKASR